MTQYDFNLRDLLHLRLVDATEQEAGGVQRQVGPIAAPFPGAPDLVVRFVDAIPGTEDLRYIGLNDAAFTKDAFLVLKGKNKARIKVMVPFDQIGRQTVEIVCERGVRSIPLLVSIINLVLLTKDVLPFHASAFQYRGQGGLVTGWAKGGKTETLLAFMAEGASYVGDEWVYLCPNGAGMFGIPEPIRVWNWHLDSLPRLRAKLKRKDKFRLAGLSALSRSMEALAGPDGRRSNPASRLAQRAAPILQRQLFVHLPPHAHFGREHVLPESAIDRVFFTASHNREEIVVEPMDGEEVARRMIFSLREEQQGLLSYYLKFRFAFPERLNPWIENLEQIQLKLLSAALKDKEVLAVYHPYPVHIPRLFEAVRHTFA
jgi:hypothetical protein